MVETGHKLGYSRPGETKSHEEFLTLCVWHVGICGLSVYLHCVCVYACGYMLSVCVSVMYFGSTEYVWSCVCRRSVRLCCICVWSLCVWSLCGVCVLCIFIWIVCVSGGVCMSGVCMCVCSL